jgi:ATP-dependent RNA helicase DBP3
MGGSSKSKKRVVADETPVSTSYVPHRKTAAMTQEKVDKFRERKKITVTEPEFVPITSFRRSSMPKDMMRVCKEFKKPSPIQAQSWPVLLSGRDLVGIAKTGSGKTLAFSLPGLVQVAARMRSAQANRPFMLVLAPTRELAVQTHVVCEEAGKACDPPIRSVCVFGGVSKEPQKQALRGGAQVVVATPGRLMDLMQEGVVDLSSVSFVVLDEADRMLDLGFAPDLKKILPLTRADRQTAMFSATWPSEVRDLAATFLKRPVQVTIGSDILTANADVKQIVEVMEPDARVDRLLELLKSHFRGANKILIFVLYKKECVFVEQLLQKKGYTSAAAIHGDLTQAGRDTVLANFKSGRAPIMIATDVAARGLDVPDIELVINYSFPLTIEDYVHRIGRTGRAGKQGVSITFFTSNEKTLAGALGGVLRQGNCVIPEALTQWGMGVKRRKHNMYGLHYRDDITGTATRTVFGEDD